MNFDAIATLKTLVEAREEYYKTGRSKLTDQEYDALESLFKQHEPSHPFFEKLQGNLSPLWKSARHSIPMGSQNKVHSAEEFKKWALKFKDEQFVMQYKLDGLSLSEDYENLSFARGITRGDRLEGEGEDISPNICLMKNFVKDVILPRPLGIENFSIRSEILLSKDNFERINSTLPEKDRYSNPRNAAAGISRRLDGMFSKYLMLISYDIQTGSDLDEDEKILLLRSLGFETPLQVKGSWEDMIREFETIKAIRSSLPYNIDGVVIKVCSHEVQTAQGFVKNKSKAQIAWKFDPPGAATTFIEEVWDVGRTGVVTPLALLEPVEIDGSEIKRATLHNIAEIKRLGIGRGDTIMVIKAGDIIPKIESVLTHQNNPIVIPTDCPSCGMPLTNDGIKLICYYEFCPRKNFNRTLNWIKVVKIEEFGESLAEQLGSMGKLDSILDIYKLTKDDISSIEGWGESSAETIMNNITQSRELTPATFLSAVGIPGISESTSEELLKNFGPVEKLFDIKVEDLVKVKGFAEISAKTITEGLQFYKEEITELLSVISLNTQKKEGKLAGLSFCFTGAMVHPRSYYQGIVDQNGGKNLSTVTKDLTYLVCNENKGSSKSQKAEKYGVKVITENDFLAMVGHPAPPPEKKLESFSIFD
jgi:DNA ligase (NAD+)